VENAAEAALQANQLAPFTIQGEGRRWEVDGDHGWFQFDAATNAAIVKCIAEQKVVLQTG
jgi:hypothetical protein